MLISQILESKGGNGPGEIVSVESATKVADAVASMSKHRIGAVLVRDGDGLSGILSERDVMHLIARKGPDALALSVSDAMTKKIVICSRSDSVDQAMSAMTEGRFRHLPVVDGDELLGMISIGDVVKAKIEQAEHEVEDLKGYIAS